MGTMLQDLKYGLRILAKNPGFTAVAVLTLALGIGANTVVFSVVNALVQRQLPVEDPERLVFLQTKGGGTSHSFPNYKELRDRNNAFTGLAGYRISPMSLEVGGGANRVWGYLATGNYFDVLGVAPVAGRLFHQEDDQRPGGSPFAVLSYDCWQRRFGGDPKVVGSTIRINRLSYTVLGVAPPGFHGTELFYWPEIWVPMMMQPLIEAGNPWLDERMTFNTWIIGRLKPDVSPTRAEADLNVIAADLAREYPSANKGLQFKLARPGLVGDALRGPVKALAAGVLGLAALVLLTACANLASLLMARAADREREIAIRLAIGGSGPWPRGAPVVDRERLAIARGRFRWVRPRGPSLQIAERLACANGFSGAVRCDSRLESLIFRLRRFRPDRRSLRTGSGAAGFED